MFSKEQKLQYELFKRVLAFLEMHRDIINAIPEFQASVEKYRNKLNKIDEILLTSGEATPDEQDLVRNMNTLLELAKKFDGNSKN